MGFFERFTGGPKEPPKKEEPKENDVPNYVEDDSSGSFLKNQEGSGGPKEDPRMAGMSESQKQIAADIAEELSKNGGMTPGECEFTEEKQMPPIRKNPLLNTPAPEPMNPDEFKASTTAKTSVVERLEAMKRKKQEGAPAKKNDADKSDPEIRPVHGDYKHKL